MSGTATEAVISGERRDIDTDFDKLRRIMESLSFRRSTGMAGSRRSISMTIHQRRNWMWPSASLSWSNNCRP